MRIEIERSETTHGEPIVPTPERDLAVAVLQRAIMDACSPVGIPKSERRDALDWLFGGGPWRNDRPFSFEWLAGHLSDDPEELMLAVRRYVTRARDHYDSRGAFSTRGMPGKKCWAPVPVEWFEGGAPQGACAGRRA